jgi:hypothetical protein
MNTTRKNIKHIQHYATCDNITPRKKDMTGISILLNMKQESGNFLFEQFNIPGSILFSQRTAINAFGSLCINDILFKVPSVYCEALYTHANT